MKKNSYEDNIRKIKKIIEELESNDLNLDENIKSFAEGMELLNECNKYLDNKEVEIQKLIDEK